MEAGTEAVVVSEAGDRDAAASADSAEDSRDVGGGGDGGGDADDGDGGDATGGEFGIKEATEVRK